MATFEVDQRTKASPDNEEGRGGGIQNISIIRGAHILRLRMFIIKGHTDRLTAYEAHRQESSTSDWATFLAFLTRQGKEEEEATFQTPYVIVYVSPLLL